MQLYQHAQRHRCRHAQLGGALCPALPSRPLQHVARAASTDPTSASNENQNQYQTDEAKLIADRAFPKSGLFSIADPKQEVYSKAGEQFDPKKKGGRFKPEFIWQTNWQEQLKRQEDLERQQQEYRAQQQGGVKGGTGPGIVSFSRLGALDDLSIDLSEQLRVAKEKKAQQQQQQQQQAAAAASSSRQQQQPSQQQQQLRHQPKKAAVSPSYQYKDLPTKNEARRFKRSTRAAGAGTVASIQAVGGMSPEEAAQRAAAAALAKARYEQLKIEFQAWAIGLGTLGTVACYYLYTKDVAISYALGASGGLTYLRLLSRTVDSVGDQGVTGGMNTAIGQPRLLIPVMLALTYNRWNALYADEYAFALNFYGMLIGFFTYKLAVLGRQGLELLSDLSDPEKKDAEGSFEQSGAGLEGDSAMTLDRIFIKKALSE